MPEAGLNQIIYIMSNLRFKSVEEASGRKAVKVELP